MPTPSQPGFASVICSPAVRSPGTASSSPTTSAKNTARLMMLLRSVRDWAAIAASASPLLLSGGPSRPLGMSFGTSLTLAPYPDRAGGLGGPLAQVRG